jgi:hypothetical protein
MPKQIINNSETGLIVRNKLNDNFTELYNVSFFTKEVGEVIDVKDICVVIDNKVYKANKDITTHINKTKFIATTSATLGGIVEIQSGGILDIVGWGLTANLSYFLGVNGAILTVPPTSGFSQKVGYSITSDKFVFDVNQAIKI